MINSYEHREYHTTTMYIPGNIIYEKYIIHCESQIRIDTFTEKCRPYLSYIIMAVGAGWGIMDCVVASQVVLCYS